MAGPPALVLGEEGVIDVSIDQNGGVLKKIITEGTGETPQNGCKVTCHYVGTLPDKNGEKFDSSRDRNSPFEFVLGQKRVIRAWDEGIATMKIGEKCLLTCRFDYAYGEAGRPPSIPPKATLNFEVELFSFKETTPEPKILSPEEKVEAAKASKQLGNSDFTAKKYLDALGHYEDAMENVDSFWSQNPDLKDEAKALETTLHNNIAASYLKIGNSSKTIQHATSVLDVDAGNWKALFRRGVAYSNQEDFDLSISDLQAALALKNTPKVKKALAKAKGGRKAYLDAQKKRYKNMFDRYSAMQAEEETKPVVSTPLEDPEPVTETTASEPVTETTASEPVTETASEPVTEVTSE